jgi:hypothetical protein
MRAAIAPEHVTFKDTFGATLSVPSRDDAHTYLGVRIEQLNCVTQLICQAHSSALELDEKPLQVLSLLANDLAYVVEQLYDADASARVKGGAK